MIYSASYWEPQYFHGLLVPVVCGPPLGFEYKTEPALDFFKPRGMLRNRKYMKISDEDFVNYYKLQLALDSHEIQTWLNSLSPDIDQTLLVWEKEGQFSHADLILQCVAKHRPDCYGGKDIEHK